MATENPLGVDERSLEASISFLPWAQRGNVVDQKSRPSMKYVSRVSSEQLLLAHPSWQLKVSSRELNPEFREGHQQESDTVAPPQPPRSATPGGPGSSWRMMRLRRVYETAMEDDRPVEEVALERFGTLETFEEAKEERRILDEREERGRAAKHGGRKDKGKAPTQSERAFVFTDVGASGASSRSSSFRRPGTAQESAPGTPPAAPQNPPTNRRFDSLRLGSQAASPLQQAHTPIPSVMAPSTTANRAMSPTSLNKLQAKVLRAKLMNAPNAAELEEEYEKEVRKVHGEPTEPTVRTRVEVLPTLDAQGRLYDVGHSKGDDNLPKGNRKKKEKVTFYLLSISCRS